MEIVVLYNVIGIYVLLVVVPWCVGVKLHLTVALQMEIEVIALRAGNDALPELASLFLHS